AHTLRIRHNGDRASSGLSELWARGWTCSDHRLGVLRLKPQVRILTVAMLSNLGPSDASRMHDVRAPSPTLSRNRTGLFLPGHAPRPLCVLASASASSSR